MTDTLQVLASEQDKGYSVYHGSSYTRLILEGDPKKWLEEPFVSTTRLLQVSCPHPTCKVGPLEWCRMPDGRAMNALHLARWKFSYEQGWWESRELTLPEVRGMR